MLDMEHSDRSVDIWSISSFRRFSFSWKVRKVKLSQGKKRCRESRVHFMKNHNHISPVRNSHCQYSTDELLFVGIPINRLHNNQIKFEFYSTIITYIVAQPIHVEWWRYSVVWMLTNQCGRYEREHRRINRYRS